MKIEISNQIYHPIISAILGKIFVMSKIGQDWKFLVSAFASFSTTFSEELALGYASIQIKDVSNVS